MPYIFERLEGDDPATLVVLYAAIRGDAVVPVVERAEAFVFPQDTSEEAEADLKRMDPEGVTGKWLPFAVGHSAPPKRPQTPPMPGRHHADAAKESWLAKWEREHEPPLD